MKKTLFAISAIAVLLGFTACTSENETLEPQVSKTITISASTEMPDPSTRTMLDVTTGSDDAGYPVLWTAGDKIKLANEITYSEFTLDNDYANKSTGEFTGNALTEGTYTAYYPADYDGTTWPTAQTYEANNIPLGVPMKATGINVDADGNVDPISFKNEGGILRLNLKLEEGADVRSVSKVVVSSTQLDKDIELNCETAVALTEDGVPFHIAVPEEAYTDLKFTIYDSEGNKCTKSLSSGKTLTVVRSKITPVNLTAKTWEYLGLCFTAGEAGATIGMAVNGDVSPNIEYSTDLSTWTDFTIGTTTVTLTNVGDKVYFRGNNPTGFSTSYSDCVGFTISQKVAASGNVMSLIDPTCQATTIPCAYCFCNLFRDLGSLTSAPELPATTLANYCYRAMFYGCESLTTAPELPATTLAVGCYCQMFRGNEEMSLTSAPELPATTLVDYCYQMMFSGCTKLNSVTCLATDISATSCVGSWLMYVETGTLYCAPGMVESWAGKVPEGWTVKEPTTGKAKATIGGSEVDVKWIQLWENGPKFAEYNVGATSVAEYGGYYCWGGSYNNDPSLSGSVWTTDYINDNVTVTLSGDTDTATKLWGDKWRMPTNEEIKSIVYGPEENLPCTVTWTDNYNGTGIKGGIITGKGAYSTNSIFLPAAGYLNGGTMTDRETIGYYWSSQYDRWVEGWYYIQISSSEKKSKTAGSLNRAYSVRAVLNE